MSTLRRSTKTTGLVRIYHVLDSDYIINIFHIGRVVQERTATIAIQNNRRCARVQSRAVDGGHPVPQIQEYHGQLNTCSASYNRDLKGFNATFIGIANHLKLESTCVALNLSMNCGVNCLQFPTKRP